MTQGVGVVLVRDAPESDRPSVEDMNVEMTSGPEPLVFSSLLPLSRLQTELSDDRAGHRGVGVAIWLAAAAVTLIGFLWTRHDLPEPRPGCWSMRFMLVHDTFHSRL